jgi:predicted dienelactone hydrolase
VEVLAWYPSGTAAASSAGPHAPYLRESIAEARAFGSLIGAPGVFDDLASVTTHAVIDAPVAPGSSLLLVLVFSHGYTGLASAYTALLEDLVRRANAVGRHTRLVLDRLPSRPRATTAGRLAARIDMARLGVFGHSMGGVTAGQFCLQDPRCRAALNLDGIPQYGA